ncbi:MAG: type II CAAX endopeptidase family protein [Brooklawnia sp.]|uniref:CPBP family intramembrane glutamic endopeptidase n=1 Tax=Brooklawnia sp. TaxID=2699740 RepID=UPI003C76D3ED
MDRLQREGAQPGRSSGGARRARPDARGPIDSPGALAREVGAFLRASLLVRAHHPAGSRRSGARRRWLVVGLTIVLGAVMLGLGVGTRPGDPLFYLATTGVAVLWAVGALASGSLDLGRARSRAGGSSLGVLQGFILGALLLAIFLAGALMVGQVPWLRGPVAELLDHARYASLPVVALITIVSGIAEELFFRGAVYAAFPERWAIPGSTVLYAASTLFTGVPLLTFAAVCLGLLTAAQRRVTGGVLGPISSHLTWSLGMLLLLPQFPNFGG